MNNTKTQSAAPQFFNRDLSWVDFNNRVLEEGLRKELPLFERLRFLSIVSSNFDEFFMVRVAAIKQAQRAGAADPSTLSPVEQLQGVCEKSHSIISRQYDCLRNEIFPGLAAAGMEFVRPDSYTVPQMDYLESFFIGQVYPVLTPLRVEDEQPFPFFEGKSINAAFLLAPEKQKTESAGTDSGESNYQIAIVQIPPGLSRIIWLPNGGGAEANPPAQTGGGKLKWALLDDVLLIWGGYLFPGYQVQESILFKVNRDADFSVDERRDEDFIVAMEEVLEGRGKSKPVQMLHSPGSDRLRDELAKRLLLGSDDLYEVDGPFNPGDLMELASVAGFENYQEKPWKIYPSPYFSEEEPMWSAVSQGDVMLHLPYQSFDPVIRFFQEAAADPDVIAIKTTLYRTGGSAAAPSPIVRALEQAALNGKQVMVLVELKARFDEERNISWANRLEKAGVIVVYGLSRLKVHGKIALVLRREHEHLKRYVHLSTGNYNDKTAKYYEDICLFTCRDEIAYDAGLFFNMITGYSLIQNMRRLVIAPSVLKGRLLELIERETMRAGQNYPGKIMAKFNSLADPDIIKALYRASAAGVKVMLCIRGICMLVPGVAGLSENIKVISVIDHYLEHSRIVYFGNGGAGELYCSSADWMPRNLERRVELMFPVLDEKIRGELLDILNAYFHDNCQARALKADGTWTLLAPPPDEKPFRVQTDMLSRAVREAGTGGTEKHEFTVRRSPPGDSHTNSHVKGKQ